MGRIFNLALENVLLEDIAIPSVLNNQDVYVDNLAKEFNKVGMLSTAIEEGFVEIDKLINVYNANNNISNIGGEAEKARVTISYESINEANDNLFGDIKHYRNTDKLSVAQEDIATTVKYILEKIKEIFARVIAWFKKLWIKLSVWWGDYDKKLKVVTEKIAKVTGDRVMLVQEETLIKLEKLYNLYLNIYKHNSMSVSLSDLITFSDVTDIFSQFATRKHETMINNIIKTYPMDWEPGRASVPDLEESDMAIWKVAKASNSDLVRNISKMIETTIENPYGNPALKIACGIVYGLRDNKIKTYCPSLVRSEYSHSKTRMYIDEGILDLDYSSGVRIVDPSINKDVVESLYKTISNRKMPLLKDYISGIMKTHDGIKKQISSMVEKVDLDKITEHKNNAANAKNEFNIGALKLSNFLGVKLPVEICLSVLDNVKLTNKTFQLIYKDLSERELVFDEIIAQINKAWKIDSAKLECLLGMKEFPYITIPYKVWKDKFGLGVAGACIRLSSKFELNDTIFGAIAKAYFSYYKSLAKHGKYVEPMVLLYNTEIAEEAIESEYKMTDVKLPEHFFYFHELGHSLLDQTYGMQLASLYGAADSKKIKFGAYAMGGANYVLSEVEVEANLFACLMTGYPVEKYIDYERIRCGYEIAARYEKIAKQKMPYIERMVPIKFRLFSSLKP